MRPRLTVSITPSDVGSRVSVRSRIKSENPGGPTTTDTVGYLRAWTAERLTIERRDGTVATLDAADLLAGKVLLHPPPQRREG